jgi:endonuclease-3 related protein
MGDGRRRCQWCGRRRDSGYRRFVPASPLRIYRLLLRRYGHAGWWPGRTDFEICVGAILTQNAAWVNVEKALQALRAHRLLSYRALRDRDPAEIAPLIRPVGYYNVKARRLAEFVGFLGREYGGRPSVMAREEPWTLRRKLLAVNGVGPETADSIALYAAGAPLFVVDAYTRRVFSRLGLLEGTESYDEVQRFFMRRLPRDAALYNDYHAQIVTLGKQACRSRPRCELCPLGRMCRKHGVPARVVAKRPRAEGRRGRIADESSAPLRGRRRAADDRGGRVEPRSSL